VNVANNQSFIKKKTYFDISPKCLFSWDRQYLFLQLQIFSCYCIPKIVVGRNLMLMQNTLNWRVFLRYFGLLNSIIYVKIW